MQRWSEFLVAFSRKQVWGYVFITKHHDSTKRCVTKTWDMWWLETQHDLKIGNIVVHGDLWWREDIQWLEILHQISCLRSFYNLNSSILSSKYFLIKHSMAWYLEAIIGVCTTVRVSCGSFYASLWTFGLLKWESLPFLASNLSNITGHHIFEAGVRFWSREFVKFL